MSYCRFSEGDEYVYLDCSGYLTCCGCHLDPPAWEHHSTADMLAHLDAHRAAGHDVPDGCIEGLKADADENDEWIAQQAALSNVRIVRPEDQ